MIHAILVFMAWLAAVASGGAGDADGESWGTGGSAVSAGNTEPTLTTSTLPDGGKIAHWPFESGGQDVWSEHHGVLTGDAAVVTTEKKVGVRALWTGTSGSVEVPESADLDNTVGLTLAAYVYPGKYNSDFILKPGVYALGLLEDGRLYFYWRLQNGVRTEPGWTQYTPGNQAIIPKNKWTHVAAARSGTTLTMYIDGNEVGTYQLASDAFFHSEDNLVMGKDLHGYMDEVQLFFRGLSQTQIKELMSAQEDGPAEGPSGPEGGGPEEEGPAAEEPAGEPTGEPGGETAGSEAYEPQFVYKFTVTGTFESAALDNFEWGEAAREKTIEAFGNQSTVTGNSFMVQAVMV